MHAAKLLLCVFLFEFIDTAGSVYQYVLTGKERMRSIRDLQLIRGYSLPSSHLTVSLLAAVERLKKL
jgi:hypothetical protein